LRFGKGRSYTLLGGGPWAGLVGAFFCTGKIRQETGPIIGNRVILASKTVFENFQFLVKTGILQI